MELEREFWRIQEFRDFTLSLSRQDLQALAEQLYLKTLEPKSRTVELFPLPKPAPLVRLRGVVPRSSFTSLELDVLEVAKYYRLDAGVPMPISWLESQIGTVAMTIRSLEQKGAIVIVDDAIEVSEEVRFELEEESLTPL